MSITKTQKKLAAGAVAGIAALALIGGGTFALWSDFETFEGNEASAGHLELNIENGPVNRVGQPLAPGENYDYEYFLSSADLDGVPDAELFLELTNLVNEENGCSGGEEDSDPTCGTAEAEGEFSEQSVVRIRWSNPIAGVDPTSCTYNGVQFANGDQVLATSPSLDEVVAGGPISLGSLTSGQGVCVRIDVGLPAAATNASQGDASIYDLEFTLEQTTPRLEPGFQQPV